jgi:hypothetical protein
MAAVSTSSGRLITKNGNGGAMDAKGWIGVAFAAVGVLFFIVAYFAPAREPSKDKILRVLASICGAAAGGFLSGSIVVTGSVEDGPLRIAISAGGALGVLVLVWLTWGQVLPNTPGFNISFPPGTTFIAAAEAIARAAASTMHLVGFSAEEEATQLRFCELRALSPDDALARLFALLPRGAVGQYDVNKDGANYELKRR